MILEGLNIDGFEKWENIWLDGHCIGFKITDALLNKPLGCFLVGHSVDVTVDFHAGQILVTDDEREDKWGLALSLHLLETNWHQVPEDVTKSMHQSVPSPSFDSRTIDVNKPSKWGW